ncbi:peptidase [Shewanella psychropiezotolerans]|uniref:Peptidase n=1 Tax=Shewanella psychropiezotolerans TaxID=2593655 RepID=A0ABX5WY01_9GAMM|nr:PepSY-associated TM helix domain-containing protein [Shewanella psychropiezotolerans]QDO83955.1 peptidase [Shewanella psychropiezotolerans]
MKSLKALPEDAPQLVIHDKVTKTTRIKAKKIRVSRGSLSIARTIHIYVSMALLILMLFFAVTGITLNHPEWFDSNQEGAQYSEVPLPDYLITSQSNEEQWRAALGHWMKSQWSVDMTQAQFSEDEISLVHKAPGTYQVFTLDLLDNRVFVESHHYGAIAVLNDLHKGRNAGLAWQWILDISSMLIILFSMSGAYLLLPQTRKLKKSLFYMVIVSSSCGLVYVTQVL